MSSSTAIIYGRGFETNKIRFKTVLQFIKNHYQRIQNNIPNGNFIVKYALEINLDSIPDDFEAKDYKTFRFLFWILLDQYCITFGKLMKS